MRGMNTPRDLLERLGPDAVETIAQRLGVSPRTITNKSARQFPAAWWQQISALAAERGVECPENIFTFRGPADAEGRAA